RGGSPLARSGLQVADVSEFGARVGRSAPLAGRSAGKVRGPAEFPVPCGSRSSPHRHRGCDGSKTTMWRVPPAVRQSCPNAAENASAARFQTLLDVAESITACRGLEELFRGLAVHLQRVVSFYALGLCLVHPDRGVTIARVP